jgi:RNA polymerase-binding protein DksA
VNRIREQRLREQLLQKKKELKGRLQRITANLRRGLEPDSAERAKQLEDRAVVDALGNEARAELANISAALARMDADEFGLCARCGEEISEARLDAYPYATECINCATRDEEMRTRS